MHCTTCNTGRYVVEIMGGRYAVLGTCGHVQPITPGTYVSIDLGGGRRGGYLAK